MRLGAMAGAGSAGRAATTGRSRAPGAMVMSAPAQSALSLPVPSLPSMTASTSLLAPFRSAAIGLGASPPFMSPESATFFPSTHTPKITLPRPAGIASSMPTID